MSQSYKLPPRYYLFNSFSWSLWWVTNFFFYLFICRNRRLHFRERWSENLYILISEWRNRIRSLTSFPSRKCPSTIWSCDSYFYFSSEYLHTHTAPHHINNPLTTSYDSNFRRTESTLLKGQRNIRITHDKSQFLEWVEVHRFTSFCGW